MKRVYTVILLFVAFIIQYCAPGTKVNLDSYSRSEIDITNDYQFPTGTYYTYTFSSFKEIVNPEIEIENLFENNVVVNQAWYRGTLTGCNPPGSNVTTTTMYMATFLVLLKNPSDEIKDKRYSRLTGKPFISCGYNVITYKLNE